MQSSQKKVFLASQKGPNEERKKILSSIEQKFLKNLFRGLGSTCSRTTKDPKHAILKILQMS